MKKIKKLLAQVIVFTMIASLAGCGTSDTSPTTKSDGNDAAESTSADGNTPADAGDDSAEIDRSELYQVDMFNAIAAYAGIQSGWYGHIVKEKFNLEINCIPAGSDDTVYRTRTAAGNLGDLIVQSKARMIDCEKAGLLYDMSPYIENYPNLENLRVAIDNAAEQIGGGSGIYAIPGRVSTQSPLEPAGRGLNPESAAFIRWDWYVEDGAPEINGLDGLLDVLASMAENHPVNEDGDKVYAFTMFPDWDGNSVRQAREMLFLDGLGGVTGDFWMNHDGSRVVHLSDDDGPYYQALKMYNTAYKLGLLDPDSSTQEYALAQAKVHEGRVLYSWWPWFSGTIHDKYAGDTPPYAMVPINGTTIYNMGYNPYGLDMGATFAIGANAEYPERLIEFYDWFASPEGVLATNNMVEGLTYEMVDGKPVMTEFAENAWINDYETPAEYGGGLFKDGGYQFNCPLVHWDDINPLIGEPTNNSLWSSSIESNKNEHNEKWAEVYQADSPLDYLKNDNMIEVAPGTSYITPSEPSDITTLRAQIGQLFVSASWKMIYANDDAEFESYWTDVIEQINSFGLDELKEYDMKIVNDIIAARKATVDSLA